MSGQSSRRLVRSLAAAPGVRLLAPGWPDAGRRVVQEPALRHLLARALAERPDPAVVLNAGVGEGLYSPMLRAFIGAARLLEFDYARPPRTADTLARRFSASLTAIPVRTGAVDLALCTEVLEHIADDGRAVAELGRILRPAGLLVLSVPTPPAVPDPAHAREGYTRDQLVRLLDTHGLEVIETRYCMHTFFRMVLRYWRPRRVPLGAILGLAWLDRVTRLGPPMDILVLARRRRGSDD